VVVVVVVGIVEMVLLEALGEVDQGEELAKQILVAAELLIKVTLVAQVFLQQQQLFWPVLVVVALVLLVLTVLLILVETVALVLPQLSQALA
jgi:hypothetical protein